MGKLTAMTKRAVEDLSETILCEGCGEPESIGSAKCSHCGAMIPQRAEVVSSPHKHDLPKPRERGFTDKDLDSAATSVRKLMAEGRVNLWELGEVLADVHDRQLWKLRVDDQGKSIYRSFDNWAKCECHIGSRWAAQLMDVATHFSREQIAELGPTKCSALLYLPEGAAREELAKQAGALSVARIKAAVDVHPNKLTRRRQTGRKQMPRGRVATKEKLSIVSVLDTKHKVALYRLDSAKQSQLVRATSLADQPFGTLDLANEVRALFRLAVDSESRLVLAVSFKRVADTNDKELEP
jgi:hypothetical protein